jgi:hypothetical protein
MLYVMILRTPAASPWLHFHSFSLLRGPTLTNRLRATCMVRFPVFRGARRNRGQANPEREPGFARARIPLAPLSLRSPPYQRQRARVRTGGQRHRCWPRVAGRAVAPPRGAIERPRGWAYVAAPASDTSNILSAFLCVRMHDTAYLGTPHRDACLSR